MTQKPEACVDRKIEHPIIREPKSDHATSAPHGPANETVLETDGKTDEQTPDKSADESNDEPVVNARKLLQAAQRAKDEPEGEANGEVVGGVEDAAYEESRS